MNMVPLGEFMPSRIPSVNPAKHPDELFELWSIPAFDVGEPDVVVGSEIGSSKKCVEPGDVLLSRIVPHIRRSWIVTPRTENRQIASGEWITFRSDAFDAGYMRHILISDPFHAEFMQTVAGVGGSLLRARPDGVKQIEIPLPLLEEQRRIAGILDQADALRRLRTRALDNLNTLGQAIFHEMFGDVRSELASNALLGDCADFFSGNTLPEGEEFLDQKDGYLILKVSDLNRPGNAREVHEAALWSSVPGSKAATCPAGAIVFPKRGGAIGTNKKRTLIRPAILDPNLMGVLPRSNVINTDFLAGWFSLFTLSDIASGSSVPQLNKKDLSPLRLRVPEMNLQKQYGAQREKLLHVWQRANADLAAQELLFASLQHRAFRGEL